MWDAVAPSGGTLVSQLDPNSVLGKVEAILDALAEDGTTVGLSALARTSGVPKASVHRICADLVTWGVVERSGDGFRLGARLFELGSRVPSQRGLRDLALPYLEELLVACGHSVHLAVPVDDAVLYLDKLMVHRSVPTPSEVANRVPLHATATGKAILAFGESSMTQDLLVKPLDRYTDRTLTDPADLAHDLGETRARGYSVEWEEFADGYASMGAPLIGLGGRVAGAVAVTTAVDDLDVDRIAAALLTTTSRISERLGAPPTRSRSLG